MRSGPMLALPPWTRWVKRLAIAHAVLYVAWLILGRWAGQISVAQEMILVPGDVHAGRVWQLVTYVASFANPLSFVFQLLALWMFGGALEMRWGSRRFLTFYAVCAVGSAALTTLLALAVDALARQPQLGPGAAIGALVVAWCILHAEHQIYFFGVVPLKGKHLLLITVGGLALYALALGPIAFVLEAIGMALGALLTVGLWRPGQIAGSIRSGWLRWRARRARRHLKSVGDDDDRRYLH